MAIIHRCDRCGSDHKDSKELGRVEVDGEHDLLTKRFNDVRATMPVRRDLCAICLRDVVKEILTPPAKEAPRG